MAHYMVDFATIDDPSRMADYVQRAREIVARHGGEFVVRGIYEGTLEGTLEPSGREPMTGVVIRWPDRETLEAMYNSPEYVELRKLRSQFSTATIGILREFDDVGALAGGDR